MKLKEVKDILDAELVGDENDLNVELKGGAASDLMSDLLRHPKEGSVLLTGLTSVQAIRTTIIAGMAAIVFVRGKRPDPDLVVLANEHGIPLLSTDYNMYTSCGKLYEKGLESIR